MYAFMTQIYCYSIERIWNANILMSSTKEILTHYTYEEIMRHIDF